MLLRRVMEHFRKQEWTAIAIDFVIVVLGVFIGIQVSNWNARQEDRRRELQIVADMLADLDIDRPQFAEGMAAAKRRVSAANAALEGAALPPVAFHAEAPGGNLVDYSFDPSDRSALPAVAQDRLWSNLVLAFHPTPSTAAFDAMVGAGDIRIMRDRNIVREIQLYHSLLASVQSQNEKVLSIRETLMNVGAEAALAPFADLAPEDYFALVARNPKLAATIRIMATFAIYHHGEMKAADARASELQKRLSKYLEAAK